MNFRMLFGLLGLVLTVRPLGGQETWSSSHAGSAPPAPVISAPPAPLKSTAAALRTLGLTAQKLTDVSAIVNGLTNRTVSVIVNLVPPPTATRPANFASKTFVTALQSETKKAQQDVLATLSPSEVKVGVRFENIAGFSAEVTASGLQALQADARVATIEPVYILEAHLAQGLALIHGLTYRSTYNGAGLSIAICDTGIDYNHARLGGGGFPNGKVLGGYDFGDGDGNPIPSTQAHGTCCAGIAAGDLGTVGDYIGGVACNAKLYALKISDGTTGSATSTAMVAAWDWCVTHQNDNPNFPIMVISTSFGGGQFFATCDSATPSMTAAANNANAAGITVLASSGNDGFCSSLAWPACISGVISVGAVYDANFGTYIPCVSSASCAPKIASGGCTTGYFVTDATAPDKVTAYANVASFLTLLAPGNQCYTLDITGASGYVGGDYFPAFGGTSAACPYAAGAVACLQSAAKAITGDYLTPAEVRERLITFGDEVTDTKVALTKPRLNLERAIGSIDTVPVLHFAAASLSGGNGNQSVDPDECNNLTVILRNDGYSPATNVTATLSTTTPEVFLVQMDSNYPDVAAAALTTNITAFKISSRPAFLCGTPVNVTLVVHYNDRTRTNFFTLSSGSSNYVVTASSDVLVPGDTDIGNHGDDLVTSITLPFPFTFYSQTFSNAALSSNGNIQFGSSANAYANLCFPTAAFNNVIAPLWDDLLTSGGGSGIFTSLSGSAPDRIFNIEWRTTYYTGGASVNFEVRLYEGQSRFDFVYGTLNGNGSTGTVGSQQGTGSAFTLLGCNAAVLTNGLQLTFQPACTGGGGECVTALADFAATPTDGFAPLTVNFTNLSTSATNYLWDFGDGNFSTDPEPVNIYTNAGLYTVALTAAGAFATNTLTRTNYISILFPPPVADFTAEPTNGITPLTVNFTNLSANATNYVWDFGDGDFSNDLEPAHTFTNAGFFTVTLTADGPGGTNSLTLTNFITVLFPPPVADFSADPTNGIAPLTVNFTNLSSNATNYVWDFGDGYFSSDFEPAHTFTNAGIFTVILTAEGPGGTNSLTVTNFITVLFPPASADFSADPTNGIAPLTVNFTNLSSNATNYVWDFGDGDFSNDFEPAHTFTNAGIFTVILTADGPGGTNLLTLTNIINAITPPLLVVNPASLDFGLVLTGTLAQATFVVSNAGAALLTDTATAATEPFAILDLASLPATNFVFTLDGATSTNVIIRFAPLTEGAFTNAVIFTSDGGDSTNAVTGRSIGTLLLAPAATDRTNFTFTFPTVPGVNYFVEYTDSLIEPVWQALQILAGDGVPAVLTNSIPDTAQRFFRVTAQ